MRQKRLASGLSLVLSLLLVGVSCPTAMAETTPEEPAAVTLEEGAYVPGEVTVMFRGSAVKDKNNSLNAARSLDRVDDDFAEGLAATGETREAAKDAQSEVDILKRSLGDNFTLMDSIPFDDDLTVAKVSSTLYDTQEMIEKLSADPDVYAAEPNYLTEPKSYEYSLNDALNCYNYQTNTPLDTNTTGDNVSKRGKQQAEYLSINAGYAWNKLSGDEDEAVIALIDSGVAPYHDDLSEVLWTNPGDIGLQGEHGFNFADNSEDVTDTVGHGTHCAGVIAAQANNEVGIAGIASKANVKIMMLATASADAESNDMNSYRELGAFNYALKAKQRGVNIVATSNSWGSPGKSDIYDAVINRLGEEGVISFAASGNDHRDLDHLQWAPAGSSSPYLVTVGAAQLDGSLAGFSNVGRSSVDVFAPGANVLSSVGYPCFFPNIYDEDKRNETTEYYGLFDQNAVISDGRVTPSLTGCGEEVKPFGASVFRVMRYGESDPSQPETTCELSICQNELFTKTERPGSLKLHIRNAKPNERYAFYFPYEKNPETTGSENTDFSLYVTRGYRDGDPDATFSGGEIIEEADGSCQIYRGGASGYINRSCDKGISVHMSKAKCVSHCLTSAEELGDRTCGIGLFISPSGSGDVIFYIDSIGVSKPNAEIDVDDSYEVMSGTSMATPAAAGAYALLASLYPRQEGQSGADYAMQTRAKLMSCIRKTDELKDFCVSGGYIDLSLCEAIAPSFVSVQCDLENNALVLHGANLNGDYTLSYRDRYRENSEVIALPANGMTASASDDGKTIVIQNAKLLFNTYTEFLLSDATGVQAKICDYLVKGQRALPLIRKDGDPNTIDNQYYLLPNNTLLTDESGRDLYTVDSKTGKLQRYDGDKFCPIADTDLSETLLDHFRAQGYNEYELLHDFQIDLKYTDNVIDTGNRLYQFVSARHESPSEGEYEEYFFLASIHYTAKSPHWEFRPMPTFEEAFGIREFYNLSFAGMDGSIYCLGNKFVYDDENNRSLIPMMYRYDVADDEWTREAALPAVKAELMLRVRDGRLYAACGVALDVDKDGQILYDLSTEIFCFTRSDGWRRLGDFPYFYDANNNEPGHISRLNGTCCAVKEGLVFFNTSSIGGGNTFLFRAATGKLEPFYCNLDDTVDANLTTQSAVETRDGLWYLIEDSDRYERAFLLYGISADSGIYTPDYQEVLLGDADGDGRISIRDVTAIQRHLAEFAMLTGDRLRDADVNGDSAVTIEDATLLQKYLAEYDIPYPVGDIG